MEESESKNTVLSDVGREKQLKNAEQETVNFRVVIERGVVKEFEELPDNSIALDGYVQGPELDNERSRYSFDHHDKCIRLVTRATCQQVMDAILLGLDPRQLTVYVNDIDGDTVLALWLLSNPARATEPMVRDLVESVGGIDAHGPAYLATNTNLASDFFKLAMKPEQDLRRSHKYEQTDLRQLLNECIANVDQLLNGQLRTSVEGEFKERSYEVIKEGMGGWVMATSDDYITDLLYRDGYTKFVIYQKLADGSYAYTIAKKSDLVRGFPIGPASKDGTILNILAKKEPGWGGASSIGGAPRNHDGSRSHLSPDEVFDVIEAVLSKKYE